MGSVETVSILITDLVGSTRLESRIGASAADQLRREHFGLLRSAIGEAGGREVKNTGDGLMAVFGSAAAAVSCAALVEQRFELRNRSAREQLLVKIGLSAGDLTAEHGDYFGVPVIEAARLCDRCSGGQILAKELVAHLAAGRGHAFKGVGLLKLKGLPEPLAAAEVVWEPLGDEARGLPLPPRLHGVSAGEFVGRAVEAELLRTLFAQASAGLRRVALLSGEPGIGKTRMSTHAALEAHAEGAAVLFGRCDEDLGLPYAPWAEALAHYVEHAPEDVLRAHVERHGGELARLVPALCTRVPDLPAPFDSDPETERYLLFNAIAGLLQAAGKAQPVILVLDDLHWADQPSLALLRHVVRAFAEGRLLILGTYRDSEVHRGHPLSAVLAELRREQGVERIALAGLSEQEIVSLMAAAAGHELDAAGLLLAGEMLRETDGNPFFVGEILRDLRESGAILQAANGRWTIAVGAGALALPQSVREVIAHRVQRLGEAVAGTLEVAAVLGREFDLDLLARATGTGEDELLDQLERSLQSSLVMESADRPGRFVFHHALVNHTLYEGLGSTRRARLHRRIAEALEDMFGSHPGARIGELAKHWAAANPVDSQRAAGYAVQAGQRALSELAPGVALRWFSEATELIQAQTASPTALRLDATIGLGEAQRQVGDPAFRETLLEAGRSAQVCGELDMLARAVLAISRGFTNSIGRTDDELVAIYRDTADTLPSDDPRRARVLALLALELPYTGSLAERQALADEALEIARRHDPLLLAHVLTCHPLATADASTRDARLRHTAEHVALCERIGDPTLCFHAYARRCMVLEAGDVAAWDECLQRMAELAETVPQPSLRWVLLFTRSPRALLLGQVAEAEALANEALRVGSAAGEPDAEAFFGAQIFGVRYEQGRLHELTETLATMKRDNPNITSFGPMLALALCESGHNDEAATLLRDVAREHFASIARGPVWISTMGRWAETAVRLGHREAAEELHKQLLPYSDHFIWNLVGVWGAVSLHLGTLAAVLERFETAHRHLAAAAAMHKRMNAPIWLARTRLAIARLSFAERGSVPAADIAGMLEDIVAVARRYHSAVLERRAEEALVEAGGRVR